MERKAYAFCRMLNKICSHLEFRDVKKRVGKSMSKLLGADLIFTLPSLPDLGASAYTMLFALKLTRKYKMYYF